LHPRGAIFIAKSEADLAQVVAGDPAQELGRTAMDRDALEAEIPGLRRGWNWGLAERSCADIDVAALHQACLASFRKAGGTLLLSTELRSARRAGGSWQVRLGQQEVSVATIVNAAGAWADQVAGRCGVASLGIQPKRRTMVQLRVDRKAIRGLPQVLDALGRFYFKGEGDNVVWLSPHDEIDTDPCDAAPEEMDVAIAIDRFQSAVDWGVVAVERKWAGLRSFAPDRLPVYGFDPAAEGFFWCAGQGGFGIQTAPAAAHIGAALLLDEPQDERFAHIDVEAFSPARFRA
jgi:D-arginine dehydrogenase